jgi:hypothetical protein
MPREKSAYLYEFSHGSPRWRKIFPGSLKNFHFRACFLEKGMILFLLLCRRGKDKKAWGIVQRQDA